jgi:hypothetical protein
MIIGNELTTHFAFIIYQQAKERGPKTSEVSKDKNRKLDKIFIQ